MNTEYEQRPRFFAVAARALRDRGGEALEGVDTLKLTSGHMRGITVLCLTQEDE